MRKAPIRPIGAMRILLLQEFLHYARVIALVVENRHDIGCIFFLLIQIEEKMIFVYKEAIAIAF